MSKPVYHATLTIRESEYSFKYTDCGKYEKFDEYGSPVLRYDNRCAISPVPQLAASKTKEGAVFAVIKNLVNDTGDAIGMPGTVITVYKIDETPDLDCSNAIYGDFNLIQEVRFEEKSKFPIRGVKCEEVTIPIELYSDVEITYLPHMYSAGEILDTWGESVLKGITKLITTGSYPDIEARFGAERPDPEVYHSFPEDVPARMM